jgi:hypothetical protein
LLDRAISGAADFLAVAMALCAGVKDIRGVDYQVFLVHAC